MSVIVEVRGESLELLPERCLYRPNNETLHAADLHWGKAEVFQRSGVAVSSKVLDDDLSRLSKALEKTKAKRLVVLGDLIHSPLGITREVIKKIEDWRAQHVDLKIHLIRGNHDRNFIPPASWRIESFNGSLSEPPFLLVHDDVASNEGLHLLTGHIHPVIKMQGGGDSLRLPCFAVGKERTLLPAFSAFTGGQEVRARDWNRLFVLTDNAVIEV